MNPSRPNIVVILADDIGYGDFGCYNPGSRIPTPNIDRLAEEGRIFTDAHSPSSVCTPSRYGILTGRYCWRSALKHGVLYGYEPPLIETGRPTLPGTLRNAGYKTACIGKWHLGLGYSAKPGLDLDFSTPLPWKNATPEFEEAVDFEAPITGGPVELGFDYFYGNSGCPTCQPPYGFIENDGFVLIPDHYDPDPPATGRPGMTAPGWDHAEVDPILAAKAREYILSMKNETDPFFLYLAASSCHEPCTEDVVPEFARGKSLAGPRGDMVWLFDWMVGTVMSALHDSGQADNTLILVTSDNGALPGDRIRNESGEWTYRTYEHASCGDLRGYKAHIWEGGHREPLVAWWPGHIPPGTTCDALICLTDLLATAATITGAAIPESAEDGLDALPELLGEDRAGSGAGRRQAVHHSGNGVFSIRRDNWKLVVETRGSGGWPPPKGGPPVPGSPGQLYDLANDPYEQRNLFSERRGMTEELTRLLDDIRHGSGTDE